MKVGVLMILPKVSRTKYKSVKRLKWRGARKLEKEIQLLCYENYINLQCNNKRGLCKNCWFNGLKVKE